MKNKKVIIIVVSVVIIILAALAVFFIILPISLNNSAKKNAPPTINTTSEAQAKTDENNTQDANIGNTVTDANTVGANNTAEGNTSTDATQDATNSGLESIDNTINMGDVTSSSEDANAVLEQLKNQEKQLFNQKFTPYETKENATAQFSSVSALFSVVAINNDNAENRKVDVNGTVITSSNSDAVKACLDKSQKFNVKCVYGDDGYVKTIELRYAQ